ncbi:hypothetical protein AOXY_G15490 [Acipenser oxyrinchus oxyrinchus]|uniref:LITAF domain-containing protein n=1 Tax=Acipenser oxyrinchus oxyrinchus TaxID=40147 RepID=A0AAD8D809_ACIOX|nr:hypothetical protein AOXY_G15490 [Acipenser oxyrinchus oxyrinchus]
MASAPPMDATTPLTGPMPPSYEDTMKGSYPYYPPNPGYPPQGPEMGKINQPPYPVQPIPPPITNQVVSMQTITVQPNMIFSDRPVQMNCPACQQLIVTRLEYTSGTLTWLLCGVFAIVGCLYGCCLIPFCIDGAKDVNHWCPNCNRIIGHHRRL